MKKLFLILLISLNVFAEYSVKSFDNGKYCFSDCRFDTKIDCEEWLSQAHPSKSLSLCIDTTERKNAEDVKKSRLKSLRNKLKNTDLTLSEVSELLRGL